MCKGNGDVYLPNDLTPKKLKKKNRRKGLEEMEMTSIESNYIFLRLIQLILNTLSFHL